MTFDELEFEPHPCGGIQAVVKFANGYGASVISGPMFYTRPDEPYELAVLYEGNVCYSTLLTDDVLGYLTADEVTEYLKQIEDL